MRLSCAHANWMLARAPPALLLDLGELFTDAGQVAHDAFTLFQHIEGFQDIYIFTVVVVGGEDGFFFEICYVGVKIAMPCHVLGISVDDVTECGDVGVAPIRGTETVPAVLGRVERCINLF